MPPLAKKETGLAADLRGMARDVEAEIADVIRVTINASIN